MIGWLIKSNSGWDQVCVVNMRWNTPTIEPLLEKKPIEKLASIQKCGEEQFVCIYHKEVSSYLFNWRKNSYSLYKIISNTSCSFYWRGHYIARLVTGEYGAIFRCCTPAWFIVELSFRIIHRVLRCASKICRYNWIAITATSRIFQRNQRTHQVRVSSETKSDFNCAIEIVWKK